jgi:hypothetical protein
MACDLANGRAEQCKDAVGGIDCIYFANFSSTMAADVTYDVTSTDMITDVNNITNLYKFVLKGANTFSQKIVSSRENGTTFFEQTLTIDLKKQDVATTKMVKLLSYGRPHVVIKTRQNQYFLAGLEFGLDVSDGSIENGTNLGDYNGYKLTFTGAEKVPANHLNCSTESALATLFSGATVVTS